MGLTVIINSMTVSHKGSNGLSIAFPDVCKTPVLGVPVPIPYPNIAMSSDLKKGSKKVKCDKQKVVLKSSKIKRSMGDEVGVQKGIISNKQMGKAKFANYSFDVKFEGKNVCRLLDPTTQNRSSLNTLAMAHLQAPATASAGEADTINAACDEVKNKKAAEEKNESPAGGPGTSGIIKPHWDDMKAYLEKANPSYLIYFRRSGDKCMPWIEKEVHEPKPHEWMTGNTLKPEKKDLEAALNVWLFQNTLSEEAALAFREKQLEFVETNDGTTLVVKDLYGIVVSRRGGEVGKPVMGIKKWKKPDGTVLDFAGKWMTGDYDMMDIIKAKEKCQRPTQADYGKLKFELNNAMKWPGIQHPHQANWNTELDNFEGDEHFKVLNLMDDWMLQVLPFKKKGKKFAGAATEVANDVPSKVTVSADPKTGRPERVQAVLDKDLTILGAAGGLHLKGYEDYWDALACCGCLDLDKPKQDQEDLEYLEGGGEGAADDAKRQEGLTWAGKE